MPAYRRKIYGIYGLFARSNEMNKKLNQALKDARERIVYLYPRAGIWPVDDMFVRKLDEIIKKSEDLCIANSLLLRTSTVIGSNTSATLKDVHSGNTAISKKD